MNLKTKRVSRYIDRKVQGALCRRVVLHFCCFIVAGAAIGIVIQFLCDPFGGFRQHLSNFWSNTGPYLLGLVLLLPVFVYDTIKLSNRITGPIYRLRKTMRSIQTGQETPDLKFRDADFWQGMATEFNEMVAELRKTEQQLQDNSNMQTPEQEPVAV